jgi:dipeptidyl aminopeptidase/acylaminoacyl peptidase
MINSISEPITLSINLKGKLLLIHGEIDNNVHPANTIRVVNALIKANKRFDMLILPTQRHGFGDMNEYWFWKTADYFSKYLLGDNTERSVDIEELNKEIERKK